MNHMQQISSGLMQAARMVAPGEMRVCEVPVPEPGAGEVRIRLEGCGVCASNLGPWSGPDWMEFPQAAGAFGHEGWGLIDAVGPGVEDLAPGDRVATLSDHAYARFDLASADAVVKLPSGLDGKPFPGEPLGCVMNIFRRAKVGRGDTVAIVGVGFLGQLLVQLCHAAGARVIAITRRPFALSLAQQAGADHCIEMNDHWQINEQVRALTDERLCDVVIEATGKQWPLDLAAELTRERGRLVIAGYHQDGPRQINMQLWNWRGLDVINAHERDPANYIRGIREAVDAVEAGSIDPFPLLTHSYPIDRVGEALDATRDRPDGFMKAVVLYP